MAKFLSREDILRAHAHTKSAAAAARFLHADYYLYRQFAKLYLTEDGKTSLFEAHKNQCGKGIKKLLSNKGEEAPLKDIISGVARIESFSPEKIKQRLVFEGYLKEECSRCGFHDSRVFDDKIPLILTFIDKNKKNYSLNNLEFLCYNCSFLYSVSPISEQQVKNMENYVEKDPKSYPDFEVDEFMKEHLQSLNLWSEKAANDGNQYISRNFQGNIR